MQGSVKLVGAVPISTRLEREAVNSCARAGGREGRDRGGERAGLDETGTRSNPRHILPHWPATRLSDAHLLALPASLSQRWCI